MISKNLTDRLFDWYQKNQRLLPWRKRKISVYHIWVSEIMLQQTRVVTVIPYYKRFLQKYPTIESLAKADKNELMKIWEKLGYYSRAINLQITAKEILLLGHFPTSKKELQTLKGIGDYTSSSIASIAFGEDCVAMDGNVLRVISRVFGIKQDITKSKTKAKIKSFAETLLPKGQSSKFNQSLMDLGSMICTPKQTQCPICPIKKHCIAYEKKLVHRIPYKPKKAALPHYSISAAAVIKRGKILIGLRKEGGMLGNLWEFPGGKLKSNETLEECCLRELFEETNIRAKIVRKISQVNHAYSHFKITLHIFLCTYQTGKAIPKSASELKWVSIAGLSNYAFPKANHDALTKIKEILTTNNWNRNI